RINQILLRFPPLHQQLLGVARHAGLMPSPTQNGLDDFNRRSEKKQMHENSLEPHANYYLRCRTDEHQELTIEEILMRIRSEVGEMRNG
ncbi:hypothetical protein RZS08_62100, partial [Arthrospira platensis SPKY1]|nr:hypothetical protein [Arthrospira platensis SPKY1]